MSDVVVVVDPLLSEGEAETVLDIWRRFPSYGLYSNEGFPTTFAPELAQRYDAAVNFVRTGGRFGRKDADRGLMAARTNYFRETYAYVPDVTAPGIELLLHHGGIRPPEPCPVRLPHQPAREDRVDATRRGSGLDGELVETARLDAVQGGEPEQREAVSRPPGEALRPGRHGSARLPRPGHGRTAPLRDGPLRPGPPRPGPRRSAPP